MRFSTLNDLFFSMMERASPRVMMHRKPIEWVSIPATELYRNVLGVARALSAWGLRKGDRVAILSENRPEWTIADFACQMLGIASVPIYSTLTSDQAAFILNDAEVKAIFISSE